MQHFLCTQSERVGFTEEMQMICHIYFSYNTLVSLGK